MEQLIRLLRDTVIDFTGNDDPKDNAAAFMEYLQEKNILFEVDNWNGPAGGWPEIYYIAPEPVIRNMLRDRFDCDDDEIEYMIKEWSEPYEKPIILPGRDENNDNSTITVPFNGIHEEYHNLLMAGIKVLEIGISEKTNGVIQATLYGSEKVMRKYLSSLWEVKPNGDEINELFLDTNI